VKLCEQEFVPLQEKLRRRKPKDAFLRFFSRKYAGYYHFGKLSDQTRTVLAHTISTADGRLVYVKNSKAGCSAVAHLLYQYDNGRVYEGDIHDAPIRKMTEKWRSLDDIPESTVSFSTVRNPERRSVSAFFNFFVDKQNPQAARHQNRIELFGFSRKADHHYQFDVFLDYIEANFAHSAFRTDRHFRPQHINLGHGSIELSYISRLETLAADLKRISEQAGVTLPSVDRLAESKKNKSSSADFLPSSAQKHRIEKIYSKDYELYGY